MRPALVWIEAGCHFTLLVCRVIAIFKDDSREEFVRTSATVLYNSTLDAVRKGFEEKKNRQFDEFNEEYMRRFIALARLYQVGRIPF